MIGGKGVTIDQPVSGSVSTESTACLKNELYNGNPNATVRRVLRKPLHLKAYKLSIVEGIERWIIIRL
jgi:hypothetical protein